MKTFKDLFFMEHPIARDMAKLPREQFKDILSDYEKAKVARFRFKNGYAISVLFGACFYSNGIDTYELGIMRFGRLCFNTKIAEDVMSNLSADEVTEVMKKVRRLKKPKRNIKQIKNAD